MIEEHKVEYRDDENERVREAMQVCRENKMRQAELGNTTEWSKLNPESMGYKAGRQKYFKFRYGPITTSCPCCGALGVFSTCAMFLICGERVLDIIDFHLVM